MNFPELFDGAFPTSAGLIIQAAPDAFSNEEVCTAQRERPIAIVHSSSDKVVGFSMSENAFQAFRKEGFPRIKLFDDPNAGHRFAMLPIDKAVHWLEKMSSIDVRELLDAANASIDAEEFNEAWALLDRAQNRGGEVEDIQQLLEKIESKAEKDANRLLPLIKANENGEWVDDYLAYMAQFRFAASSKPLQEEFALLQKEHQPKAEVLYKQSKKDYQTGKRDAAYAKYQEVVDTYYASTWYPKMKKWIADRK